MLETLGVWTSIGGNLKETGTTHWNDPNTGATNTSGFAAVGGGWRQGQGIFDLLRQAGYWWTSTIDNSNSLNVAYYLFLENNSTVAATFPGGSLTAGFSIRCIKNQ